MHKTKICLSFWSRKGRTNRIRREEKEKKKKNKKRREEGRRKDQEEQMYGKLWIFVWKNRTRNLFFYEFGSKRTLLGILVVFGNFRLDLELFWFDFLVDLGL